MLRCQFTGFIQSQITNLARHLGDKSAPYGALCRAILRSSPRRVGSGRCQIRSSVHCIEFGFNVNTDISYQFLLADRVARCISRLRINRRELHYVSAQKFILERCLQLDYLS